MSADDHELTERKDPLRIYLECSCGWRHSELRRQNAWARAAKLRAAERKHAESIELESEAPSES